MPLKLLGKKSWNVYNAANIARVQRDEAEARAQEANDKLLRKEAESAHRLAILRGEDPDQQLPLENSSSAATPSVPPYRTSSSFQRKRKRHGEDDTDFEMRMAQSQMDKQDEDGRRERDRKKNSSSSKREEDNNNRPLVDSKGHIDLFGVDEARLASQARPPQTQPSPPNDNNDNPFTVRFSDAAGRNGFGTWYTGDGPPPKSGPYLPSSSNRRPRPPLVTSVNADPLAAMKRGAATVRALNQERQQDIDTRARELSELKKEQDREEHREEERTRRQQHGYRHKRHRRRRDDDNEEGHGKGRHGREDDTGSLDGFILDNDEKDGGGKRRHRHRDEQRHDRDEHSSRRHRGRDRSDREDRRDSEDRGVEKDRYHRRREGNCSGRRDSHHSHRHGRR